MSVLRTVCRQCRSRDFCRTSQSVSHVYVMIPIVLTVAGRTLYRNGKNGFWAGVNIGSFFLSPNSHQENGGLFSISKHRCKFSRMDQD